MSFVERKGAWDSSRLSGARQQPQPLLRLGAQLHRGMSGNVAERSGNDTGRIGASPWLWVAHPKDGCYALFLPLPLFHMYLNLLSAS